jgi:hypothetical protein
MVIKFLSPQAYYSQEETRNTSVLKAKIYLEYKGENGELVPYEKEQDITIKYLSIQKDLNYGAILILLVILLIIWLIIYTRKGNKRMAHLEEEVEYLEEEVDELEK